MTWKKIKLKKLITQPIQNGYSPLCQETPSGRWVLGLGALNGSRLDITQIKPAPDDDKRVAEYLLRPGDFLISRSNTVDKVGRVALFKGEIENCSYPDLMMRFRVDNPCIYSGFLVLCPINNLNILIYCCIMGIITKMEDVHANGSPQNSHRFKHGGSAPVECHS